MRNGRIRSAVIGWISKAWRTDAGEVPVISTQYGPVSQQARLQCAINMRDPEVMERVVKACMETFKMSRTQAVDELKRRYPEAFQ